MGVILYLICIIFLIFQPITNLKENKKSHESLSALANSHERIQNERQRLKCPKINILKFLEWWNL